jgi:hypothetical protein
MIHAHQSKSPTKFIDLAIRINVYFNKPNSNNTNNSL